MEIQEFIFPSKELPQFAWIIRFYNRISVLERQRSPFVI